MVVVHGKKCEVGKGRRDLREIRDLAEERGVALIEVRTEREGHCEELVRDADLDGVDAVGVMGGDGTFREGVCGMIARGGGTVIATGSIAGARATVSIQGPAGCLPSPCHA